jgi:DNA-binding IclR family transcriptional regulator
VIRTIRLGPKVIELAGAYLANSDLRNQSQVVLDGISAETNETVHLAVRSGAEVVCIARWKPPRRRMYSYVAPACRVLHRLRKAMLAFGPDDWLRGFWRGLEPRPTLTQPPPDGRARGDQGPRLFLRQ